MINLAALSYQLVLVKEDGSQFDITGTVSDLSWEEGEGELAVRISFTADTWALCGGETMAAALKPGRMVLLYANWGDGAAEVARGRIQEWSRQISGSESDRVQIVAYDDLLNLQKSEDNRYYAAGTGTKSAICGIFSDWGIPLETYSGANVRHEKTMFKAKALSDIIAELLDDAVKKGGARSILRQSKGKVSVLKRGGNETVYRFDATNALVNNDSIKITDLVTRVKVVGKEDDNERQAVEAVVNGRTEFGVRQKIETRDEDASLADAKQAAQAILAEEGTPVRERSLEAPDVPELRRGDRVQVVSGWLDGYYIVKSIRHNADEGKLSMELEAV